MIKSLGYVMLVVQNMEQSVEFYTRLFQQEAKVESPRWSQFNIGQTIIALHSASSWSDEQDPLIPFQSGQKGVSFGFWVEDVNAAFTRLKNENVKIIYGPRKTGIGELIYIEDPDGHIIQLCKSL